MDTVSLNKWREIQSKIDKNFPQQEFCKLQKIADKVARKISALENAFLVESEFRAEMQKVEEVDFARFMSRNKAISKIEYGKKLNDYSIKISNGEQEVYFG